MELRKIEQDLLGMLATERGVRRERIHQDARLLHDLGMDGDDAVDFFRQVHDRFGTDFSELYREWDRYFGPEVLPNWAMASISVPALAVGFIFGDWLALPVWGGFAIVIVVFALVWGIYARLRRPLPLTVEDLLAAVCRGRW